MSVFTVDTVWYERHAYGCSVTRLVKNCELSFCARSGLRAESFIKRHADKPNTFGCEYHFEVWERKDDDFRPEAEFYGYFHRDGRPLVDVSEFARKNALPAMHETQESVVEWGNEHYPGEDDAEYRFKLLLEEVMELGVAMGLTGAVVDQVRDHVYKKAGDQLDRPDEIPLEIGDVSINLKWLCDALRLTEQECLNDKMTVNRQKTPEQSAQRALAKGDLKRI